MVIESKRKPLHSRVSMWKPTEALPKKRFKAREANRKAPHSDAPLMSEGRRTMGAEARGGVGGRLVDGGVSRYAAEGGDAFALGGCHFFSSSSPRPRPLFFFCRLPALGLGCDALRRRPSKQAPTPASDGDRSSKPTDCDCDPR